MAGLPPPPAQDPPGSYAWVEWYRKLREYISTASSIPWAIIQFSGSTIADIASRLHADLQGMQGGIVGERYHLTATEHASLSSAVTITTVTTSTILSATEGTVLVDTTGGNITITLPNATSNEGKEFTVKRITAGANTLTIDTSGGNIDDSATISMPTLYESLTMQSDGTDYWIV